MADPQSYRPTDIPANPGVYRFIDEEGRVIYVGKASSLRNRLSNYFQDPAQLHPRTRAMVFTAVDVKWVVVGSEIEALTLEYAWIKEFAPRFNVMYRDDKSYPYLTITMSEQYPRVLVTRNAHRRKDKYYGPYTKVWAVREALDLLLRVFPMRSCTKGVFNAAQRSGRPCLNGYIDRCAAPCVGRVTDEEHRAIAREMIAFLDSSGEDLIKEKTAQMKQAALEQDFEKAARLRDDVAALTTVAERNSVVLDPDIDADIFGLEFDELEASVQVFFVRGGRIRGQRGWVTSVEDLGEAALLNQLVLQVYGEYAPMPTTKKRSQARSVDDVEHTATDAIPREIWLPAMPEDSETLETWLSQLRGARVKIRVPQRGAKAQLAETVHTNAVQALQRHKIQRAGDITERSQALEELRDGLGLERAPLRIECYDISHTQGTHQVGSMVVFEDARAKKSDYRHFIVRGPDGNGARDDTAAMDEVLRRRLARLQSGAAADDASDDEPNELPETETSKPRKFAYKPDLIVVDGGLPQVNAAQRVVDEMGADVTIIGLAKRLEEIWIPGEEFPVILSRSSPALRLLQYLRDESHRFAITFHRKKRSKAMTRSALDEIPGLGPAKQKSLLKHFGSLAKIKAATREDLLQAPGIGPALADVLISQLAKHNE
ncbi:excinuclease ABC subunit UvrC [Arcanobacterium phocisimile]|uniref:UvrABC system protein C n=1 Tax=Arcanobacterium phocisimile TaxID=1302235 RepID=A0ABX7IEK8_9ACTO|nr:excinuclease ABC subunit UvrC [Arcanobacterium phocisimile]QRV01382.1 excinuclease ABC subunit UvrC [Arcanobacterium phocisimile]